MLVGFVVLAEGPGLFRLRGVYIIDECFHQQMFPCETWLDECLRLEPKEVGIKLAEGLCD